MDYVAFEIFSDLEYRNDEGTLVVHWPGADFAILRCSVTSIFRNGVEVFHAAEREIPELARKANTNFKRAGEKLVTRSQKPSSEDPKSTVYSWYIGLGGHIALMSVFVDYRFANDERTKRLLDCAELLAQSFRRVENAISGS
jgi:hypothetical protein